MRVNLKKLKNLKKYEMMILEQVKFILIQKEFNHLLDFKLNDLTNSNDLLELPLWMKCKLMPDAHIMLSNIDDNIDATYLSSVMETFIK